MELKYSSGGAGKYLDLLRISIKQVLRQWRRYLGVFISIALGTAGVIVILTMGEIVKFKLNQDLNFIGGVTVIYADYDEKLAGKDKLSRFEWFHDEVAQELRARPDVMVVSLSAKRRGQAKTTIANKVYHFPLVGVDENYWAVSGQVCVNGAFFGKEAVEKHQLVCVLGQHLANQIFGTLDILGKAFRIDNSIYKVVGILGAQTSGAMANGAYIPLTTAKDRLASLPKSNTMIVRCTTWDDVETVATAITETIGKYQTTDKLRVNVPLGQLKQVIRIVFWVEVFIYFSVAATLLLGGYGIWNGMMTAVKARTREIGLKKAMGAQDRDIMFQFFSEGLSLTVASAIVGVGLGLYGVDYVAELIGSQPARADVLNNSGLSVLFSLFLGCVAGFFPSLRAARMEVVTAIRYE